MSSPNPNSNIPAEILIKVFCEVDYVGIVKCRAVCRFWASVISSSATLQYLVWMEITQKADGNSSCSPRASADRLKLLLDHEFSWSSLRPQRYRRHEVPFGIKAYISGQDSATIRHDITAGPDETSQMLFLHHLDSTLGSSEEVSKPIRSPIHAFGVANEGWTVDVDNELVVIASRDSRWKSTKDTASLAKGPKSQPSFSTTTYH
ncbi:hypothetical protein DL93DRAFT_499847 [Clavulina sp. PMI_390]|nr:hypothetical protein DL93DRAFT_499847 [Clavulina sp. PMI_390]